jgi:hypothetical protein
MSKRITWTAAALLGMGPFMPAIAGTELSITAETRLIGGQAVVRFELQNVGSTPIRMAKAALPWGPRHAAQIVAIPESEAPLPRSAPIDDSSNNGVITILPGTSLHGDVALAWPAKQRKDLVIFWHCRPKDIDANSLGEFGGWARLEAPRSLP